MHLLSFSPRQAIIRYPFKPSITPICRAQNTQVSEEKEFKKYFWKEADTKDELYLDNVQSSLWCYTGDNANPCWKDVERGNVILKFSESSA